MVYKILLVVCSIVLIGYAEPKIEWFKEASRISGMNPDKDTGIISCLNFPNENSICVSKDITDDNWNYSVVSKNDSERQKKW
jgi:hypothetical protein